MEPQQQPRVILMERIVVNLEQLLNERDLFEQEMYDLLVSPFHEIDESFWEPVKISFDGVKNLEDHIGENICSICTDKHLNFKKLNCCKQKMCNGCCYTWFENSVKCPYCFQDIREFNLKNPR